jgi:hypothetical protein
MRPTAAKVVTNSCAFARNAEACASHMACVRPNFAQIVMASKRRNAERPHRLDPKRKLGTDLSEHASSRGRKKELNAYVVLQRCISFAKHALTS